MSYAAQEMREEGHRQTVIIVFEINEEHLSYLVDPVEVGIAVHVERLCGFRRTSGILDGTTGRLEVAVP